MLIKLSPSAVHSGTALASLLCAGKFKVGYFSDSPRSVSDDDDNNNNNNNNRYVQMEVRAVFRSSLGTSVLIQVVKHCMRFGIALAIQCDSLLTTELANLNPQ
jgi:hypothetical protein